MSMEKREEDTQAMERVDEHTLVMPRLYAALRTPPRKRRFFDLTRQRLPLLFIGGFILAGVLGYASAQYMHERLGRAESGQTRQVKFAAQDSAPRAAARLGGEETKERVSDYAIAFSENKEAARNALAEARAGVEHAKTALRRLGEMLDSAVSFIERREGDIRAMRQFAEEKRAMLSSFLKARFGESEPRGN